MGSSRRSKDYKILPYCQVRLLKLIKERDNLREYFESLIEIDEWFSYGRLITLAKMGTMNRTEKKALYQVWIEKIKEEDHLDRYKQLLKQKN